MEDPVVLEIAKAHGKTPAHVLMKWLIQRGIAVIPKSTNPGRIVENAKVGLSGKRVAEAEQVTSLIGALIG